MRTTSDGRALHTPYTLRVLIFGELIELASQAVTSVMAEPLSMRIRARRERGPADTVARAVTGN